MNDTLKKFKYKETLIKEFEHWMLLLRMEQVTLGSMVLVTKNNEKKFSEVSSDATLEIGVAVKLIESKLLELFSCNKVNYLMLMMVDPDVHFHVIPRYSDTVSFNSIDFCDKGWPGLPVLSEANQVDSKVFRSLNSHLFENFNF